MHQFFQKSTNSNVNICVLRADVLEPNVIVTVFIFALLALAAGASPHFQCICTHCNTTCDTARAVLTRVQSEHGGAAHARGLSLLLLAPLLNGSAAAVH